jgi:hypothetical protein
LVVLKGVAVTGSNDKQTNFGGAERRTHLHIREIFEEAYRLAYPMLASEQSAGSTHFLRVVLHDSFPDLHLQDVAILTVAIERVYRERSKEESH